MPRDITAENALSFSSDVVTPRHLFTIVAGNVTMRLSDFGAATVDGRAYISEEISYQVDTAGFARVRVGPLASNIDTLRAARFAQITVRRYDSQSGTGDVVFEGDLIDARESRNGVSMRFGPTATRWLPQFVADESTGFNHLPPPGTKLETPEGTVVLN